MGRKPTFGLVAMNVCFLIGGECPLLAHARCSGSSLPLGWMLAIDAREGTGPVPVSALLRCGPDANEAGQHESGVDGHALSDQLTC